MLILDEQHVARVLSKQQIIAAVEEAIIAYEKELAIVPMRMHVTKEKNTLLCMPSWGEKYFGTKLVSVVPDNSKKNLPVIYGTMLLNDGDTGAPLCLLNASALTALRTGAVGAIGARHISPPKETSMGLIGCGIQGLHQVVFIAEVLPIDTVYFLKRPTTDLARLKSFVALHHPQLNLVPCVSPEELLSKTNLIVAATTSAVPVLPGDERLLQGKHFISIGSYNLHMRELPDTIYSLAEELVIDSEFARKEVGDIASPIKLGLVKEENVFSLGKLLTGKRKLDNNKTTVFKSAGMALFDLYVAQAMYEQALSTNTGTVVQV